MVSLLELGLPNVVHVVTSDGDERSAIVLSAEIVYVIANTDKNELLLFEEQSKI